MVKTKQYKVKLNSREKIEELLQEIYSEACKNIEETQRLINKIEMSTNLNDEILDGKAKFSKAMNDFIKTKDNAIGRMFEIAKLMSEILKYNGNIQKAFTEGEVPDNWGDIVDNLPEAEADNKPVSYTLK